MRKTQAEIGTKGTGLQFTHGTRQIQVAIKI